jgi:aldehyde dehydrogenase (NAD+)
VQLQRIQRLVEQGINEGAEIWQPSWACPADGYFIRPRFTNVSPAATIAQVEIFGPVLVSMTFRSPEEAVSLANNTRYGLAASVWSENLNVALDTARRIKAGTIWINSTNIFDASSGFGGYRESGYGREGGREGMYDYLQQSAPHAASLPDSAMEGTGARGHDVSTSGLDRPSMPAIDRTPKLLLAASRSEEIPDTAGPFMTRPGMWWVR